MLKTQNGNVPIFLAEGIPLQTITFTVGTEDSTDSRAYPPRPGQALERAMLAKQAAADCRSKTRPWRSLDSAMPKGAADTKKNTVIIVYTVY